MVQTAMHLVWFTAISTLLAYAALVVTGNLVRAQAEKDVHRVIVRDVLGPGVHNISGMVMVRSTCDELSMRAVQIDLSNYALDFETWREPYRDCAIDDTPRAFHSAVFAPAVGVTFTATLDGDPLDLEVIPVVNHS